tara:strand:- start:657 stop:1304 length:648 start_codon:yes stop_codon:yes gene_type:complete
MVDTLTNPETKAVFQTRGTCHQDGWGIAYFKDNEFEIKKSTDSILIDKNVEKLKNIKTNQVMLHARYQTIGEKSLKNTQPFKHGKFLFCHNGTIKKEIQYDKEKFLHDVETDSEKLFYSILSKLPELSIPEAIRKTFQDIDKKPNSNIILSSREKTYIYSSSRTIPNYMRMQIGTKEDLLIVSSEILPQLNLSWQDVLFDRVIVIDNKTLTVTIE